MFQNGIFLSIPAIEYFIIKHFDAYNRFGCGCNVYKAHTSEYSYENITNCLVWLKANEFYYNLSFIL